MFISTLPLRVLAAGCLLTVALAGQGALASASAASVAPQASNTCTLPVTHDTYDGYHIGVPTGWEVLNLTGTIIVAKNPAGNEEAMVYPALLTAGLTPSRFFSTYMQHLEKLIAAGGNSMTYKLSSTGTQLPAATLTGRAGGVSITGRAVVVILPDQTAHSSSQIAVEAYWAPTSQLASQKATLTEIDTCYGPQVGSIYHVFHVQGDPFTFEMPLGWQDMGESSDAIILQNAARTATGYYEFVPGVFSSEANSPGSLINLIFQKVVQIGVTHVIWADQLPNQTLSNGAVEGQMYAEFLGTGADGSPIHGLVYAESVTGGGVTSGVMRLGLSTPALWNSTNGALIQIMGSIQHDFTQDLETWAHMNQQWQQEQQNFQNFDNVISGFDWAYDPATATDFEAPYQAFQAKGPAGPGYYDGSVKLKTINP